MAEGQRTVRQGTSAVILALPPSVLVLTVCEDEPMTFHSDILSPELFLTLCSPLKCNCLESHSLRPLVVARGNIW